MNWIQKQIAKLLIPRGCYCEGCPFWFKNRRKPSQMNGYCSYLGKGDWDFYEEMPDLIEVEQRQPDGSYKKEMIKKEPMFGTMLYEGIKECEVWRR